MEAEESVSRFEVLSSDITGISEQQAACDELCSVAKVCCVYVFVCFGVNCNIIDAHYRTAATTF